MKNEILKLYNTIERYSNKILQLKTMSNIRIDQFVFYTDDETGGNMSLQWVNGNFNEEYWIRDTNNDVIIDIMKNIKSYEYIKNTMVYESDLTFSDFSDLRFFTYLNKVDDLHLITRDEIKHNISSLMNMNPLQRELLVDNDLVSEYFDFIRKMDGIGLNFYLNPDKMTIEMIQSITNLILKIVE